MRLLVECGISAKQAHASLQPCPAYTRCHLFMGPLILGRAALIDPSGRPAALVGGVASIGSTVGPAISGVAMGEGGRLTLGMSIAGLAAFAAVLYLFAFNRAGLQSLRCASSRA